MRLVGAIFSLGLLLFGSVCPAQVIKSVDDYKAEAKAAVSSINITDAKKLVGDDAFVFIDVREGDELDRLGKIEGSVHVSRGVLEFYIDPGSSMHMDVFSSDKQLVFYCATGGRSLLAAKVAKDMGMRNPLYLEGGYKAWKEGVETQFQE